MITIMAVEEETASSVVPTFEQVYHHYHDGVRRYIAYTVYSTAPSHYDIVDDLVQETFIKVWRAYPAQMGIQTYSPWVFTIAHHTCIDWIRHRRVLLRKQEALTTYHEESIAAPDLIACVEEQERLARAWAALRPREARILSAVAYGYRYTEIAEVMDIRYSNFKTVVMRARRALHKVLQTQEIA